MRCVLDSNVVVAAMRSPLGASAFLLKAARRGEITMLANVALALEYEATCRRLEHIAASGCQRKVRMSAGAAAIVTFNRRDFGVVPLQ